MVKASEASKREVGTQISNINIVLADEVVVGVTLLSDKYPQLVTVTNHKDTQYIKGHQCEINIIKDDIKNCIDNVSTYKLKYMSRVAPVL